jgi:type I restriction enzyme S subunit
LLDITRHHSGNSKLIKGKLNAEPGNGLFPAFSATGQDVWRDGFESEGDAIIVSAVGARCGKCFLASDKWSAIANTHVVWPKPEAIDRKFLWYRINDEQFWIRSGTAQPFVVVRKTFERPFPLPPLPEQRRIVGEIEKQFTRLEAGVAALRRVQANLHRYRAAVLKAACEGRLVPTEAELVGRDRRARRSYESGAQLLQRILKQRRDQFTRRSLGEGRVAGKGKYKEPAAPNTTGLPQLPEGWCWASMEQLSNVVRGSSPRPAGDPRYFGGKIPWITVGPITADNSPYLKSVPDTLNDTGRKHSRYIEPHTLLLTNSGATLGVPKVTLIGGCINDGVAALLDVEYPLKLYLLYFLRTQTDQFRGVNQGAAQPNLNTTIIKAINVPLPPVAEQERIVAEVERRLSVVEELSALVTANLQRATRLRQAILQKAFEGKLVANDEVAGVGVEKSRQARHSSGRK